MIGINKTAAGDQEKSRSAAIDACMGMDQDSTKGSQNDARDPQGIEAVKVDFLFLARQGNAGRKRARQRELRCAMIER